MRRGYRIQLDPESMTFYAPPDGDGDGNGNGNGGGGDGNGGGGGGGGNNNQPPPKPWAEEFGDNLDPDRAWRTITNQRESERQLKAKNSELATKLKQYEDSGKSPFEKLQSEMEELRGKVTSYENAERERKLTAAVSSEAEKLGAHYPQDIYRLLDPEKMQIENGEIKNAPALLRELKAARPALFRTTTGADAGAGRGQNPTGGDQSMNSLVRGMFGVR